MRGFVFLAFFALCLKNIRSYGVIHTTLSFLSQALKKPKILASDMNTFFVLCLKNIRSYGVIHTTLSFLLHTFRSKIHLKKNYDFR
jgi:hypothetical protein